LFTALSNHPLHRDGGGLRSRIRLDPRAGRTLVVPERGREGHVVLKALRAN
jgi:hypothetical protein